MMTPEPVQAPFGSWESPITAPDTVAGVVGYSDVQYDHGILSWLESRPSEGGRSVLVRRLRDGTLDEPLGSEANVRTMVHEYGGGAYVASGGEVVYSEFTDQRLHRLGDGPLTPEPNNSRGVRYADAIRLPDGSFVCVRETHAGDGSVVDGEAVNELVRIDTKGNSAAIATGSDFYSSPRISPDGTVLAWLEWDHPNMPWDGTRLVIAPLAYPTHTTVVAGATDESIVQPEWDDDGSLVFVSDRTGWWNLYRLRGGATSSIAESDAEFSSPQWGFGERSYGFLSDGRIVVAIWDGGVQHLAMIDIDGKVTPVESQYSRFRFITTDGDRMVWFAGSRGDGPSGVAALDVASGEESIVTSNERTIEDEYVSVPDLITFPTSGGDMAHGVFYPPQNPRFTAPTDELPPLLVRIHGGPTSQVSPNYSAGTLFWTSRGFAVVDVNYRGSTGFGRVFRQKLTGEWGIADVDDAAAAAEYLASQGAVDGERLAIFGGSAGGYTALAAIAFKDVFAAGVSYYGVADIEVLGEDTHKFESQYVTGLVGSDPEVWRERSPLYSADQIDVPVALFQGLDDKIVPPNQAVLIAEALDRNGIQYVHVEYEGEGHGFRKAENIIRTLETELAFYGSVFGFET